MNRMMLNPFLVSFKNIRTMCCFVVLVLVAAAVAAGTVVIIVTMGYNAVRVKQLKKNKHTKIIQNGGNLETTHPATECHSIVRITHLTSLLLLLLWDFIWTLHIAWFEIYSYKNYCFKKWLSPSSDKIVVGTKMVKDKSALHFRIKQVQSTTTVSH